MLMIRLAHPMIYQVNIMVNKSIYKVSSVFATLTDQHGNAIPARDFTIFWKRSRTAKKHVYACNCCKIKHKEDALFIYSQSSIIPNFKFKQFSAWSTHNGNRISSPDGVRKC